MFPPVSLSTTIGTSLTINLIQGGTYSPTDISGQVGDMTNVFEIDLDSNGVATGVSWYDKTVRTPTNVTQSFGINLYQPFSVKQGNAKITLLSSSSGLLKFSS